MNDAEAELPTVDPELEKRYTQAGWWGVESLSEKISRRANSTPDTSALVEGSRRWDWRSYDQHVTEVADALQQLKLWPGSRVVVYMPDGNAIHAVLAGCARAGLVAVGIGARSGDAEVDHLMRHTSARVLIMAPEQRDRSASEVARALTKRGHAIERLLTVDVDGNICGDFSPLGDCPDTPVPRGPNDISILNSTSGTTGLPKCVTQFDNRWLHLCDLATIGGHLTPSDRVLAAIPTPYGFGLWTSHYLGPHLGVPTYTMAKFDAGEALRIIDREKISVLACVTTQFRMMLASPVMDDVDLSSLRVMYTGGEAIPYERAREFEIRTGCALLQFFGSNETGAVAYSSVSDSPDVRLFTGGKLIPHMEPRLYDPVTGKQCEGRGQPGVRGPLTCLGYFRDEEANKKLYSFDGWMLMGDIVEFSDDTLRLVGRTSDIIIRGGKNLSAAEIEAEIETHPDIVLASVVPVPDDIFGEKVCAVVTTTSGGSLSVGDLGSYLDARGVTKEWFPEYVIVVDDLPRNAGGKIAKSRVRELALEAVKREDV